ncbi:MAG: cation:proton antiporter subunit C [Proteobacteria bacterium]|nr:cation:proton antiporter subunit C [Pseudomonadota bacterium]
MDVLGHYNYWISIALMMAGFYLVIARANLIKKLVGLNVFQTAVFLLYISIGKVSGGTAPIAKEGFTLYSNPLPSVLILTAIVVAVSTTAVALAIIVRIREAYGTVEEDEILEQDEA